MSQIIEFTTTSTDTATFKRDASSTVSHNFVFILARDGEQERCGGRRVR